MSEIKKACNGPHFGCDPKQCVVLKKSCSQCGKKDKSRIHCCSSCAVPVCRDCVSNENVLSVGWLCKLCAAEMILTEA
jgi:hypothetical protein